MIRIIQLLPLLALVQSEGEVIAGLSSLNVNTISVRAPE